MKTGEDVVQNRKSTYERILNYVEPFLESIPQVIVCTASLFSAWGKLTGNLDDAKTLIEVTGGSTEDLTPGWVDIPWNFAVPFALSLISASYGIVKFYKDGPLEFIDTSGILSGTISIMFFVNLVGTMSFMVWRLMMMASMITSTGYLIPLLFSPSVDLFSAELYGPLQLAPAVAAVKTVEVKAAPVAAVAYTAPVVHHVGYQVHHQVHHVPMVLFNLLLLSTTASLGQEPLI